MHRGCYIVSGCGARAVATAGGADALCLERIPALRALAPAIAEDAVHGDAERIVLRSLSGLLAHGAEWTGAGLQHGH